MDKKLCPGKLRFQSSGIVIANDQQLQVTMDRIAWFQRQAAQLRSTETSPKNYLAAVSGFLAEIDRMQLEVREYLSVFPADRVSAGSR